MISSTVPAWFLRPRIADVVAAEYPCALRRAVTETGLPARAFPGETPDTIERLLDDEWLPDQPGS
jgi:hypothetical protein